MLWKGVHRHIENARSPPWTAGVCATRWAHNEGSNGDSRNMRATARPWRLAAMRARVPEGPLRGAPCPPASPSGTLAQAPGGRGHAAVASKFNRQEGNTSRLKRHSGVSCFPRIAVLSSWRQSADNATEAAPKCERSPAPRYAVRYLETRYGSATSAVLTSISVGERLPLLPSSPTSRSCHCRKHYLTTVRPKAPSVPNLSLASTADGDTPRKRG